MTSWGAFIQSIVQSARTGSKHLFIIIYHFNNHCYQKVIKCLLLRDIHETGCDTPNITGTRLRQCPYDKGKKHAKHNRCSRIGIIDI